ncbi:MAG: cytochrome P450 [Actinobacteria bacterium]|nr:cytochrome P450 [Actinomycetota bacterium]
MGGGTQTHARPRPPLTPPRLPPGPASPGPWQLIRCQANFAGYLDACMRRHGPLFTLRMPPFEAFVAATEPRDVETILLDTTTRFEPGAASAILEPLVGPASLILSAGPQHMHQRRLLLPAFHGKLAERWEQQIAEIAARHLARLPLSAPIPLREPMREIALDAICRILFGGDEPATYRALRDEVARGLDPRIVVLLWFPTLWRRHGRLNPARPHQRRRAHIHGLVHELIARRRADATHAERDDVLSVLVAARDEHGEPLSDGEIRDLLLGLLMAGHETTANALTWAFERLSRTPHARERLAEEVRAGGTAYVDAVVSETLRTRPSVIDAVRTATSEIELSGYAIPPGTVVSAMLTAMHRRPDLWPDPLAFRPERFLDGRPPPYSYMPFGGGVRHCIGASLSLVEMRAVLRTAVGMLDIAPAPNREERMRLTGITLTPSRGGRVVLARR